ncbi:hypothetical protein HYS82_03320 [Candidatus Amesbacteria bacterium]|nr:hypothetical protein [Candidatus Amesbacteria bacterium]
MDKKRPVRPRPIKMKAGHGKEFVAGSPGMGIGVGEEGLKNSAASPKTAGVVSGTVTVTGILVGMGVGLGVEEGLGVEVEGTEVGGMVVGVGVGAKVDVGVGGGPVI